jgi:hypothetical protein
MILGAESHVRDALFSDSLKVLTSLQINVKGEPCRTEIVPYMNGNQEFYCARDGIDK